MNPRTANGLRRSRALISVPMSGLLSALLLGLLGACSGLPSSPATGAATAPVSQASHAAQPAQAPSARERAVLAPTGALRVGVYNGSPSSYVPGAPGEPARGVGYLLGQALAESLGVPFEPVVFPANAALLAAVGQGKVDVVFTNATAERARSMDFSPTVLDVQKSVLVPAASPLDGLEGLRGKALRIGVSAGSSTGSELKLVYPEAQVQPVPTLQEAARLLQQGGLDGFATNNAILFELADRVPGSRVLPGAWGLEHFALGIPPGRREGADFVGRFARDAARSGRLQRAVEQSRLRGTVAP